MLLADPRAKAVWIIDGHTEPIHPMHHGGDRSMRRLKGSAAHRVARRPPHRFVRASTKAIELMAGLSVCFTGEARDANGGQFDRARQTSLAEQHGLVVTKSVTKKGPDLVVAADGDSRSEKARKARQNGIPVATFSAFVDALRTGETLTVAHLSSYGLALVCVDCGDSWLAPRRARQPVCAACSSASLLAAKPAAV
ncbi:MAG TPA: BRCT domain-containing protein [Mycobacterium sp.]|nr:BRCT domain-containing protein [Mycobacterium sp.]